MRNRTACVTCVTLGLVSVRIAGSGHRLEMRKSSDQSDPIWNRPGSFSSVMRLVSLKGGEPRHAVALTGLILFFFAFPLDKNVSHHHLHSCLICAVRLRWSWAHEKHAWACLLTLTCHPSYVDMHLSQYHVAVIRYTHACTLASNPVRLHYSKISTLIQ